MNKKGIISLALAFAALTSELVPVSAAQLTGKSENMFINGGFEDTLNHGWYVERMSDYERVTDNPHSGEYCCRNLKDYSGERYCQDFLLTPGETYDLSFWARVEKGSGSQSLTYNVRYGHLTQNTWNATTKINNRIYGETVTVGEEWQEYKATFTYTGYDQYGEKLTAHNAQFNVTPNSANSAKIAWYFDDFSLIPHGDVEETKEFMPEEFEWAEDPLPAKKEIAEVDFADIDGSWAESTITALAGEGIISGMDSVTYAPDKNVTRAEMLTLVMNMLNVQRNTKASGYDDVAEDAWYANSIAMAKRLGIISDKLVENNKLYPDKPLTRGEVCSIAAAYADIIGAVGGEAKSFIDSSDFGVYSAEIEKASALGIISGYPDGKFLPNSRVTRAEIAEIIKKLLELSGRRYFYVDPENGNDEENDGTYQKPYATIYKAQEAVRANNSDMKGNLYVFLKGGDHSMPKTLNLSNADSGTNGYNIVYTSYGEGEALLRGGMSKKYSWEMYDSSKNIYRTYVGALNTRQLYVNGVRAIRARSEEKLANYSFSETQEYQAVTKSMWLADLSNITDVEVVHNGTYYCNYRPLIAAVKKDGDVVRIKFNETFMKRHRPNTIYFGLNLWVENALELVDNEGEWFLSKEGYLYYIPRAWENIDEAEFTLPTTEILINGVGEITDDTYKPLHNLTFKNVQFGYTTGVRQFNERGGLGLGQDCIMHTVLKDGASDVSNGDLEIVTASTYFENVSYLDFKGCTWKKIGNTGLTVNGGMQHMNIIGNNIYDITANGMQISVPLEADADREGIKKACFPMDKRYYQADVHIENNYIHDTAVEFFSAGAIAILNLQYSNVSNNEIFRTTYSGIHSGWGFSARPFNLFYDTSLDHNYIHKTNLRKYSMNDGGAIYHMGTAYGDPRLSETTEGRNKISYNYCEDQGCTVNNIYLDEGAGWMEISHNVFDTKRELPWTYGVITTGNKGKCNVITENYLCNDSITVAGKLQRPFTEWYAETNGVLRDEDIYNPEMVHIGEHYIIGEDMSTWDQGALDIVENAGITDEYIDEFPEEFQDFEIISNSDGYDVTLDSHLQYLPAVFDIASGEEIEIPIKAKNRKKTEGYISPDRIWIYNKNPDIVEVTGTTSVKGLKPGKAELVVRILCGENKDVVADYDVEVYVDDEINTFPGSEKRTFYWNGSGGDVKSLTGDETEISITLTTKFGRTLKAKSWKATSSNDEYAYIDDNGVLHAPSEGSGEFAFEITWGAHDRTDTYTRPFKIVDHEMYTDFDKSQIVELGDEFLDPNNWNYVNPNGSDTKERTEDSFKIQSGSLVSYTKEKFNNKLLHFKLKINYGASTGWPSFSLNCADPTKSIYTDYILSLYPTCFEWQRFNNGNRTVLWGNGNMWDGTHAVYGGRPGAKIPYNEELDVGVGCFDVEQGVRVVMYLNGLKVFDQIDYKNNEQFGVKDAPVLSGGGYFGIYSTHGSYNMELFKADAK